MPKVRRKFPRGIHPHESGSLYICYKNEHGRIIRENTHQTDVRAAEVRNGGDDGARTRDLRRDRPAF